ncbi:FMN-dependent NADH-azoreductase [Chitinophaga rhizophila]|uniref:FMN dependent NADH:quinone oxidoreductase n=1 Tax=Chitinophaga rhizophila TaxID=2866212 RepID=A0ABS7GCI2_9BACT|nr:NAD(P)H-dependent oxidoreductase [Chitinophaga rhizophila]MBW8684223.1 NAD(P)H-dependent oxidoreductase [Chitinophaga rhizophila]
MKKILKIVSSVKGAASKSTQLADAIIEQLIVRYPGSSVKVKDLTKEQYAHFDAAHLAAFRGVGDIEGVAAQEAGKASDDAIAELLEADIIVLGVPLYNFHIPSTLKAWLDHVVRGGKTFSYAKGYPEGLVSGKKAYIALASGAIYSEGPAKGMDFAPPYLQTMLNFIGITDTQLIRAEGCDMPGVQDTALEKALATLEV